MTEPIPCPVCRRQPEVVRYGTWFMVQCPYYACDYLYFYCARTENDAIRMWNIGAIDNKVQEEPNE